jgi:hypothetical protein
MDATPLTSERLAPSTEDRVMAGRTKKKPTVQETTLFELNLGLLDQNLNPVQYGQIDLAALYPPAEPKADPKPKAEESR